MKEFFVATIYTPLYNIFVAIIDIIPTHEVFWAAIIFTVIIKLILSPLAKSAMLSQIKIKRIQGDLKRLQEEYKDKREVLAAKMMALYRDNNINPLSPILVLLIQIPIILSLFFIFKSGLPVIDAESLYSFIPFPGEVQMVTFGIDLAAKSLPLAFLTGFTQFLYTRRTFSFQMNDQKKDGSTPGLGVEFQKALMFQFTYIMPVIITIIAYSFSSVLALYWTTSNIFAYIQDIYIRKRLKKEGHSSHEEDGVVIPEVVSGR